MFLCFAIGRVRLSLNKILPWLTADRPDLFNAYQQTQGEKLERAMRAMEGVGYLASFIGNEAGKSGVCGAVFH